MRFDDSLKTVLAGDTSPGIGAQSTWRQLVDLIGRGRVAADEPSLARLRLLRQAVPIAVRAASARALAFVQPPAGLVALMAEDDLAIAAPVLRTAALADADWLALLPRLTPTARSVLRHRRDLAGDVVRGLESFGAVDFVLDHVAPAPPVEAPAAPLVTETSPVTETPITPPQPAPAPIAPPPGTPLSDSPFLALGAIARELPVVAEALRRAEVLPPTPAPGGGFQIADLVARIDAFNRDRPEPGEMPVPAPADRTSFRFETDADGIIRWVDGVTRLPLVGIALTHAAPQGLAQLDGIAAGAFRRRSRFADARLQVGGSSDAAGDWRLSGMPLFDAASGRFTGMRGTARRPRVDETAQPARPATTTPGPDSLRQLVHELRTPMNAISGFAELIESELLGPVSPVYRDRAAAIRAQAADLVAAIEDLDTAARLESHALALRPVAIAAGPLLARIVRDLAPLARLRGASLVLPDRIDGAIEGDDRAVERLVARLLSALLSVAQAGERIGVAVTLREVAMTIAIDRPAALPMTVEGAGLAITPDPDAEAGAPLLGLGFALRLARNLAAELGGSLTIAADRLTLRLPAALDRTMGQAIN